MRTLNSTADAARLLRANAVLVGIRIDFPSPVGTKWFTSKWRPGDISSSDLRRTVKSWGPTSQLLSAGPALAAAAASVILSDHDGELRGWWEDFEFQRLTGRLVWAVFTAGQAEPGTADAVEVLACTIVPPVRWLEGRREIPLGLSDMSISRDTEVGTRAVPGFHASFTNIGEEDLGRVIPTVFGRPDRVRAISLDTGARARLTSAISDSATTLVVDDASGFPQGESIDIAVGDEIVTGTFTGNTFTITARGKVVHAGTLTADSTQNCVVIDSTLIGYDDNWCAGYYLVITPDREFGGNSIYGSSYTLKGYPSMLSTGALPYDDWQQGRKIIRFDGSTGKIEYAQPFVVEMSFLALSGGLIEMAGNEVRLKAGTSYQIRSLAEPHDAGAEVRCHVSGNPEYAVGMDQCTVRQVYLHGVPRPEHKFIVEHHSVQGVVGSLEGFARATLEANQPEPEPEADWLPVPAEYWSTSFYTLAGTPGFTTVVLARPPGEIPGFVCDSDEVLVDIEGPKRLGSVIANPADVIASLLDAYTDLVLNLLDHAEQFDQWDKLRVTVSANAAAAPDGTQTADKVVETAEAGTHRVYQSALTNDGGSAYPLSVHAKAGERTKLMVRAWFADAVWVKYDLSAGTVISTSGDLDDYGIEDEGDGWYRCWFKETSLEARDNNIFDLRLLDAAGNDSYTGDGSSGLYLWGALFERSASLGDYDDILDFSAAKGLLASWGMSFALAEQRMLLDIIGDLAFQARCRVRWLGTYPELLYQHADGGDPDLAVASSRMMLDSIERSREEMDLAASEVTVHWMERGRRHTHPESDPAARTRLGRRSVEIDCWAYNSEEAPKALARFYLARIRHLHDLARLDASVFAVGIEPGDTVTLDADGKLPDEPVKGQVGEAVLSPGKAPEPPATVGMAVRLYHWAGCSLGCEGSCETMGCETYCESWFEPGACWSCEASCQGACELGCTAAAEFLCAANECQTACTAGCEALCLANLMIGETGWGCGACEASCQTSCEMACETACESSCESACEPFVE